MSNSKLTITDASKVFLDDKTKELLIYDCKEFAFDGKLIMKHDLPAKNTLRYKLCDDKIYLE